MNVQIGTEASLFPEKEYINRIAVAVQTKLSFERRLLAKVFHMRAKKIINQTICLLFWMLYGLFPLYALKISLHCF